MAVGSTPTDTICAVATAPGEAAIGVIRVSGPSALSAADRVVRLQSGRSLKEAEDRRVSLGHAVDESQKGIIDEVLVTAMRAPKSYTREDRVELSCPRGRGATARRALGRDQDAAGTARGPPGGDRGQY